MSCDTVVLGSAYDSLQKFYRTFYCLLFSKGTVYRLSSCSFKSVGGSFQFVSTVSNWIVRRRLPLPQFTAKRGNWGCEHKSLHYCDTTTQQETIWATAKNLKHQNNMKQQYETQQYGNIYIYIGTVFLKKS